ncbi:MAG TPA: DUF5752 family protein [Candidatus Dormibacteraeota bacterium]|nr:DUF5752 family protein [Candidatus Dormibacteraeota bacterium]
MTTIINAPVCAKAPFHFATASYLVRIGNQVACDLLELQQGIADCSDASIFHHTFQSLGRHHFLTEGFSNDFAQWVLASCNRPALAEQLASLDIRDYVSLADLRGDLGRLLRDYCQANPREAQQTGFEPFYFAESLEEEAPLGIEAWTLAEFYEALKHLPHGSMQFHFVTSRLRLHLRTNDFSVWISRELGLRDLARRIDQIDVYTNTLDSACIKITRLIESELHR